MPRCVITVGAGEKSRTNGLHDARVKANVSQRQAAKHAGITPQLIYAVEHSLAEIPQDVIDKLTAFYAQESAPLIVCDGCGHLAKAGAPCIHCGHERT